MNRAHSDHGKRKPRLWRDATEFLAHSKNVRFTKFIARKFVIEHDAVVSTAWIIAYGIALEGQILDGAVRVWRQRVIDAVRRSAECACFRHQSLDEQDANSPIDERTPEAILLELEFAGIVAQPDENSVWPSEGIYQSRILAERLGVSERHARRIIARWRRQDEMRGDDV